MVLPLKRRKDFLDTVKTYIPAAVDVATAAHRYLTRYQSKLTLGATTDQIVALTELITCLAAFLSKWLKPPPIS